ncbi:MAG: putative porin [Bradyrhizobium sp.]
MSRSALLGVVALVVQANSSLAVAQDAAPKATKPVVSRAKPTSFNSTVNLLNLMVQKGMLSEEEAQVLIKQAEDEAYVSRQAAKDANTKADEAEKTATAASAAAVPDSHGGECRRRAAGLETRRVRPRHREEAIAR